MRQLICTHCSGNVEAKNTSCPNCGTPLAPDHAKNTQKSFKIYFIVVVIICVIAVIVVPQMN